MRKLRIALTAMIVTAAVAVPSLAAADATVPTTTPATHVETPTVGDHRACGSAEHRDDDCTWAWKPA